MEPIIHEFSLYRCVSGIGINRNKMATFALTPATPQVALSYQIQWVAQPFKYLGVWLTDEKSDLITANYGVVIAQLEDKIDGWLKLLLSLLGISVMKMGIMQKLLFLLLNIPLRSP